MPDKLRMGEIAPGFEQGGGGTQYRFPGGIKELERFGCLKEIS
ncbi:glycohydrolase toxin TNT-related protein [Microbacterium resistens]